MDRNDPEGSLGNDTVEEQSSTSGEAKEQCPICLGPFLQKSYLDTCFHKFCYKCILQWAKIVASKQSPGPSSMKCPLCKNENFSAIYGYDGSTFQRHYFNQNVVNSSFFSKVHKYRLQCYYIEPGIMNDVVNVSRYWKLHKYLQPNQWLQSWLKREIQALLQEEDVEIIVHHILGVVHSFWKNNDQIQQKKEPESRQEEFKAIVSDAARQFLSARTERFVNELELFLASGFNIDAYDKVYLQRLGWDTSSVTSQELEGEFGSQTHVVPYLYIFDEDYDETD